MRTWIHALLASLLLAVAGCVEQRIAVTSNPAGASVYYDGLFKGLTPSEFDFAWYGEHRFKLYLDGYQTVDELVMIRAPLYMRFPVDFGANLLPVTVKDQHPLHYDLVPLPSEEKKP